MTRATHLRPRAWLHSLASRLLYFFAGLFSDVDVEGLEHLPRKGGAVLIANHRSYFDAIALAAALAHSKRDVMVLAKSELFATRWKAWLLTRVGTIPVYRGTQRASESLNEAVNSLRHGEVVALFPEGTIPADGRLMAFKTGAARIALSAGVPVIPVALVGTDHVIASNLAQVKRRLLRNALAPHTITVKFGAPIHLTGDAEDHDTVHAATETLRTSVNDLLDTIEGDTTPMRITGKELALGVLFAVPVLGGIAHTIWRTRHKK